MVNRLAVLCLLSALVFTGCATKNDAGIVLHKKPDLTKVTPGTPVKKVAGLKKPIKKEVLTKGELKGAEAWLFEWDLPNDEVNNKMFTSVVVKDGIILGFAEESADKWSKNPKLHKAAKMDSAWEDMAGYMAQAARYQAAASALASYNAYNATRPQFDPVQAASAIYANSYQPWNNSGTVNYGMVGGGSQPSGMNTATRSTAAALVDNTLWQSGGISSRRNGNMVSHSDGTSSVRNGNMIWNSDGTSSVRNGNIIWHSDGTSSSAVGQNVWHSGGGTSTKIGNNLWNQ